MAEKAKAVRNFERSYSGDTVAISMNDDVILEYKVTSINGAETLKGAGLQGLARYSADVIVGIGNMAKKADGATDETVAEKMAAALKALQDGTFKFRSASGSGELSDEEIQEVMAATLVEMGKLPTIEDARKLVTVIYNTTTKNKKGYDLRPDFNEMKRIPKIRDALAKAEKVDSGAKVDSVLSKFQPKPEGEQEAA